MSLRVLIAVTHLVGAGHLMRASAIGRALAQRGHGVTLVSGGMTMALADVAGLDLVQLPPVRSPVESYSTLLDAEGRPATAQQLEERRRLLVSSFHRLRPDVVITEQFPFGRRSLAAEFQALLDAAALSSPKPLLLASIRDILVAPTKPDRVARTHAIVARHYGAVLVHGDEASAPLDLSWPVDEELRLKLVYTGYVGPQDAAVTSSAENSDGAVVVSGGSSAASLPLYRAALAASRAAEPRPWRLLIGHAVDEDAFRRLQAEAPAHAIVERARRDFRTLLTGAAVFVGQAGYNTVMDLVATRVRSVLVPFEQGRETEQRLRAEGLAARGLITLLPEADLSPEALLRAIGAAEAGPKPEFGIALEGQERSALIVEDLAARFATPDRAEAAQ